MQRLAGVLGGRFAVDPGVLDSEADELGANELGSPDCGCIDELAERVSEFVAEGVG